MDSIIFNFIIIIVTVAKLLMRSDSENPEYHSETDGNCHIASLQDPTVEASVSVYCFRSVSVARMKCPHRGKLLGGGGCRLSTRTFQQMFVQSGSPGALS
jgi:hypothetical protein